MIKRDLGINRRVWVIYNLMFKLKYFWECVDDVLLIIMVEWKV